MEEKRDIDELIKKKKMKFILIMIGVALLSALVTYVLITYVFNKKEEKIIYEVEEAGDKTKNDDKTKVDEETKSDDTTKEKVTTVKDPVALSLYSYFDMSTFKSIVFWEEVYDMKVNSTKNISDLDQSIKNEMAFNFISKDLYSTITCNEAIEALVLIDTQNNYACGKINDDNTTHSKTTTKIDEKYIKESVEKIFGPNSYSESGFGTYFYGYGYYAPEKAYVYFEGIGGEMGESLSTYLVSAKSTIDTRTLTIELYQEENQQQDYQSHGTFDLLYKLSNNNYYLYSIKKVS